MAFQEIMIAPIGASSITEAVQMGAETYQQLKKVITKKFGASGKSIPASVNLSFDVVESRIGTDL